MATIVKAPNAVPYHERNTKSIFLAGSIDMGNAVDWQTRACEMLAPYDIVVLNPRRDDWDSGWVQDISNPQFKEQVAWELEHLEACDLIVMYFDPAGAAPISLLELGLFGIPENERIVVCCPEGYWRRGNVQIVCDRYNIQLLDDIDELLAYMDRWCMDNA